MSFETCFWNVFEILVFFHPLVLSSSFQVLWNLKIFDGHLESIFDKDDVNVLEMNFVGLTLIGDNFVRLQDVENVLVLHKDHVFFVDVVWVLVVNEILSSLEILWLENTVVFQILSSKRRWKKNNHANEFKDSDPAFCLLVEEHPAV